MNYIIRGEGSLQHCFLLQISRLHFKDFQRLWQEAQTSLAPNREILSLIGWYENVLLGLIQQGKGLIYHGVQGAFQEVEVYDQVTYQETWELPPDLPIVTQPLSQPKSLEAGLYLVWNETFPGEVSIELSLSTHVFDWKQLELQQEILDFQYASLRRQATLNRGIRYAGKPYEVSFRLDDLGMEEIQMDVSIVKVSPTSTPVIETLFGSEENLE